MKQRSTRRKPKTFSDEKWGEKKSFCRRKKLDRAPLARGKKAPCSVTKDKPKKGKKVGDQRQHPREKKGPGCVNVAPTRVGRTTTWLRDTKEKGETAWSYAPPSPLKKKGGFFGKVGAHIVCERCQFRKGRVDVLHGTEEGMSLVVHYQRENRTT